MAVSTTPLAARHGKRDRRRRLLLLRPRPRLRPGLVLSAAAVSVGVAAVLPSLATPLPAVLTTHTWVIDQLPSPTGREGMLGNRCVVRALSDGHEDSVRKLFSWYYNSSASKPPSTSKSPLCCVSVWQKPVFDARATAAATTTTAAAAVEVDQRSASPRLFLSPRGDLGQQQANLGSVLGPALFWPTPVFASTCFCRYPVIPSHPQVVCVCIPGGSAVHLDSRCACQATCRAPASAPSSNGLSCPRIAPSSAVCQPLPRACAGAMDGRLCSGSSRKLVTGAVRISSGKSEYEPTQVCDIDVDATSF